MMDCFHLHHGVGLVGIVPEVLKIVLPCHHLHNRPTTPGATVECECGRKWKLVLKYAGKAWNASEVVDGQVL